MSSTTTRSAIGGADIEWYDGVTTTFTRLTSTGGQLTLNKIGNEVDVAEAYGAGTASYAALQTAIGTIGSNQRTLVLKPGTWSITTSLTIPANLTLKISQGAILAVATTKTLTINGPIEAGPYQIFSWAGTGAISLANSPTADVYFPWWGGQTGLTNDIATSLAKAATSGIAGKHLIFPIGIWRLATATSITETQGFTICGEDGRKTCIVIDVGASEDGLTIGASDVNVYNYHLKSLNFIGAADACLNGLVLIKVINGTTSWVNFYLGAAEYCVVHKGTEHFDAHYRIGFEADHAVTILTPGTAVGGVKYTPSGGWYNNTYNKLKIHKSGTYTGTGYGLYLDQVSSNMEVSGVIENVLNYAIYADRCRMIHIDKIYTESTEDGLYMTGCQDCTITGVTAAGTSNESPPTGGSTGLQSSFLKYCQNITIKNSEFGLLNINPSCRGISIDNITIGESHGLQDYANDTTYLGPVIYRDGTKPKQGYSFYGENRTNYISNALFSRWQADRPYGWTKDANTTWTQETSTIHNTTYSAKAVVTTGAVTEGHSLTTEELNAVKGHLITWTLWVNIPSGQTFTANAAYLSITVTAPTYATGTGYVAGNGVVPGTPDGNIYMAENDGTSDSSEPTWDTDIGDRTLDNDIYWVAMPGSANSTQSQQLTTTHSDGKWRKIVCQMAIPSNATAVSVLIIMYPQTGGDGTFYLAEPQLMIGNTGSKGVLAGYNEFGFLQVSANRLDWDSLIPTNASSKIYGKYSKAGDIVFNTGAAHSGKVGWVCTTAGINGTDAVWYTWGAID